MGNRLSVSKSLDPTKVTFGEDGPGKVVFPDSDKGGTEGPEVIMLIGQEKWLSIPTSAW